MQSRARTVGLASVVVAVTTLAACGGGGGSSSSGGGTSSSASSALSGTLKIGVPMDLSGGPVGPVGKEEQQGIELAVDEANSSHYLGGVTISLDQQDTKSDKATALTAVQTMINQDNVNALVGFSFTVEALAAIPSAQQAGVPTVSVGTGDVRVPQIGDHVFLTFPLYNDLITKYGPKVLQMTGGKKAAYIVETDSPASVQQHDSWVKVAQAAGVTEATTVNVTATNVNFSAEVAKVKASNPDVIIQTVAAGLEGAMVNQLRQAGVTAQVVGGLSHGSASVRQVMGDNGVGDLWIDAYYTGDTTGRNSTFVSAFKSKYGKDPDLFNAVGYDGMWLMLQAVKKANSLDRAAITSALQSMTTDSAAQGSCTIDSSRILRCPGKILKIGQDKSVTAVS